MYNSYNSQISNYYGGPGSSMSPSCVDFTGTVDENAATSLLQHLSKIELQTLLEDDNKLVGILRDLPQVKNLDLAKDDLVARNKSLAEYNLSLRPHLDQLKTSVATAYETLNKLKSDLIARKTELDKLVGDQTLDTVHALLQAETATAEEESEQIADSLCEKTISIDEFQSEFLPKRTLAHKRHIKAEKMAELLRDQHLNHRPDARTSWPMPMPMLGQTSSSVQPPYPVGPSQVVAPYPYGIPQSSFYRQ